MCFDGAPESTYQPLRVVYLQSAWHTVGLVETFSQNIYIYTSRNPRFVSLNAGSKTFTCHISFYSCKAVGDQHGLFINMFAFIND